MPISEERTNRVKENLRCILICGAMCMANMQYGFDLSSIGGIQAMVGFLKVYGYRDPKINIGWGIETQPQQLISSCLNLGTIIGLFFTTIFARYFGRRPAIWMASILSAAGSAAQIASTSLSGLCIGRILIGTSNSFFLTFANIYIVEATPHHLRIVIGSLFGIWVNIGAVLGSITNQLTQAQYDNKLAYQIPLACLFFVPLSLSIIMLFIPESPRWLLVQGRYDDAEHALKRLRGNSLTPELFREEFIEMSRGIEEEKTRASSVSFMDIFRGSDLRRTIICVGVTLSHSSSGLWLFLSYSTYFFQMAGFKEAFHASIYTFIGKGLGAVIGMYFMFKLWGRRSMMLFGTATGSLCMLAVGIAESVSPAANNQDTGRAIVAFCVMFGFFYNGFSGTISWPLSAEIVSSRLRVVTFSFATCINYFFSWLIAFTTPYFINKQALNWGGKYGYVWAGSNLITFVFFWFLLPETKGRTLEEIDELFVKKLSVKEFPTYICTSSTEARDIAVKGLKETATNDVTEERREQKLPV